LFEIEELKTIDVQGRLRYVNQFVHFMENTLIRTLKIVRVVLSPALKKDIITSWKQLELQFIKKAYQL